MSKTNLLRQLVREMLITRILFLALFVLGSISVRANAEVYFAPELIGNDPDRVADLSRFTKNGQQMPGTYRVSIFVNNHYWTEKELVFSAYENEETGQHQPEYVKDNTGLLACLTRSDLADAGVNVDALSALNAIKDEACLSPGQFIKNASTSFNFQKMRLDISIPQAHMQHKAQGYISPERWDEGINALLLDYSFNGNQRKSHNSTARSHYLNLNTGINIGAWRLRDNRSWNAYHSRGVSYSQWQHQQTWAERSLIPLKSHVQLGDLATGGDIFDTVSFRGVQISTDENMYPDSLRGFAPTIRGNARTNAQVIVCQNGYDVYQTYVPPGAFTINDLYAVNSSGDLDVLITEADGSTTSFVVPFSSVPLLQREGQTQYSLTAGRYQNHSQGYEHPPFLQATLVRGFAHNITAYTGTQLARNYTSLLGGTGLNLGRLGAISMDITQANSTLTNGDKYQGRSMRLLYARSLNSTGTAFQLAGYRYSTAGFYTLEEAASQEMSGWRDQSCHRIALQDEHAPLTTKPCGNYFNLRQHKKSKIQLNMSQQVGSLGTIFLSGTKETYRHSPHARKSLQTGLNASWGSASYSLTFNYNVAGASQRPDRSAYFNVSFPLNTLPFMSNSQTWANYSINRDNNGHISHQSSLSGVAFDENKLSWNMTQGYSGRNGNSGSLSETYKSRYGSSNAGYSYGKDYRQISYGLAGGIIFHGEGVTVGQTLGDTNILVAAPGIKYTAVENETGISTDWRGYAIKPFASAYRENRVALDAKDLDYGTDVDNPVMRMVPTKGAVVKATFNGRVGKSMLVTLSHKNKFLPFGSFVTAGESSGIVGDDGQVYLSGMAVSGEGLARWGGENDQRCHFTWQTAKDSAKSGIISFNANCR